ncbi:MAG: crossover junction endodeoxyribonuclease RuvC [Candidatus Hydrogenedentes bacterium]|jgi:crossover junction endodeoxyribonuclease RuvC|nr:crossover junction endodeoxyribonuclease RuvC [Candidatus Hydrogenedentota bacterium]NLT60732.1 crossover junction endodeoxyribonuclease RuvC [Candidatus Hydrogenedentota bacterium]HNZ18215.1 crossover junction endodeoxyribonuclease RuvC [Candidatus Hydrogenedentota bacterium]HOH33438.1 crossover junction endodeoxyribonuclease RuvC [Candidatus Hydrogenedentota bacterium]HPV37721.1 crossover junction endodeoxyribonuclease RuvC [Candidatus Hydrogenedentota bacterium]
MRVLGFDPGTATTGYGVVEGRGTRLRHIAHGVITTPAGMHFAERLRIVHDEAAALFETYAPDAVAIEKLYFARNVTTALKVAEARGVIALAAAHSHRPIGEFSPLEVKNAVVGYGKATKKQVQEMVKLLLNLDALPRPDDAADALALAICQIHAGNVANALRAQT